MEGSMMYDNMHVHIKESKHLHEGIFESVNKIWCYLNWNKVNKENCCLNFEPLPFFMFSLFLFIYVLCFWFKLLSKQMEWGAMGE